ncbi:MAG: hypothetical protein HC904_12615 [Blastochloris sp.]|nr:hypothetical protein [Blastochloris sp.]
MARAQAWLLRKQQKATIYTVVFGNPGGSAKPNMQNIANDPRHPDNYTAGQTDGRYYDAGASANNLRAAFQDIAARISVRLTR